jgi:hypothetical protein
LKKSMECRVQRHGRGHTEAVQRGLGRIHSVGAGTDDRGPGPMSYHGHDAATHAHPLSTLEDITEGARAP